jgi:CBS domain-containing protein
MIVRDIKTQSVQIASPEHTIRNAAEAMATIDAGVLPVGENDRLIGMITDRDIALRAVSLGKSSDTPVREVMTTNLCYCFDDQNIEDVGETMSANKVRRLPVLNREKRLVGIVSLGDMARADGQSKTAAKTLNDICE